MRKLLVTFGTLGLLAATPANAQMRKAELPDVYESYNDCFAATEHGINVPALITNGWAVATVDGEPTSQPTILGHGERAPIILVMGDGEDGICVVTAKLSSQRDFDQLLSAWEGVELEDNEAWFIAEGRAVQIARTGTRSEPSVRLVVGARKGN